MNCRQATHMLVCDFLGFEWNRLAAETVSPGDACCSTQFWVFWMKGLTMVIDPPGDASFWFDFNVLGVWG